MTIYIRKPVFPPSEDKPYVLEAMAVGSLDEMNRILLRNYGNGLGMLGVIDGGKK